MFLLFSIIYILYTTVQLSKHTLAIREPRDAGRLTQFYNAQTTWCWLEIGIRLLLPVRVVLNSYFNFLTF